MEDERPVEFFFFFLTLAAALTNPWDVEQGIVVRFQGKATEFSLLLNVQIAPGARLTS